MSNVTLQTKAQKGKLDQNGIRRIVVVLVTVMFIGLMLFLSAGTLDWIAAWVYLGIYLLAILTAGVLMVRVNPDLINERGKGGKNTKGWDKVIALIFLIAFIAMFIVAGLDARWSWAVLPFTLQVIGVIGLLIAMPIIYWAMFSNPFLSTVVRIQDDRGHRTVTAGPYRFVRHPMYVGTLLYLIATPLILGSGWALIPSGIIVVTMIVRTALEDRTLQKELPGYAEYAQQVRYRLLPYVW